MYLHLFIATRAIASRGRILFGARRARSRMAGAATGRRTATAGRSEPPAIIDVDAIGLPGLDGTEALGDMSASSRLMSREQLLYELWGPVYLRETQYVRSSCGPRRR